MTNKKKAVEKPRASRDGHEYHEIWAARRAMQLLRPDISLTAIAVENLSPSDVPQAIAATTDIADLTLYYGKPEFEHATRTTISQFKYSVADDDTDFRVSHAKQTIEKFAATYKDYRKRFGSGVVTERLDFELVTNRPIYKPFLDAIVALKCGGSTSGEVAAQSKQFTKATGLSGKALAEFAGKVTINGLSGSLPDNKRSLSGLIVDWSGTSDALASSRLGDLKDMVRDKAGHKGTQKNLIMRTDILAALGISEPDELLPCKPALPKVGKVVEREQLPDAVAILPTLTIPLLVHAAGGVGKTVFMESLANAIDGEAEIVFFDCFGGGAYRSPSDARHLPKKGLIHIANTLAFRGLCDPILPNNTDTEALLGTFRRRLIQCCNTLKDQAAGRYLAIFIDAIDNAQLFADLRGQESFPALVLESLLIEPIAGVKLIVSCRTERKPKAAGNCRDFPLIPFSIKETATYLSTRLKRVSDAEIKVAQARSGGNARVLEYLVKSDRGLLDQSEVEKAIELDDLLQQRITAALSQAIERGYEQKDIDTFLAGLAILPPPVPLDEYASANGMKLEEIESFASDLSPLLERTNQGLMFRDEPTETLVRNRYSSLKEALERVANNLLARQESSVYAARALPSLLQQLDSSERLFSLAFDDRIPSEIKSTVGTRKIKHARIKAATLHAATKRDYNKLVRLLVELSTISAVDEKGTGYILEHPELVVAANDTDAMRRLFETRTKWPGTRHARLAISNALAGDSGEAYRHAKAADEWIHHYFRTDHNDRKDPTDRVRPTRIDVASVPFFLVCEGRTDDAQRVLERWFSWYSFEVGKHIFDYLHLATELKRVSSSNVSKFVKLLPSTGTIAAAIAFHDLPKNTLKELIAKLAHACKGEKGFNSTDSYNKSGYHRLEDGMRKASALGICTGMKTEALVIMEAIPKRHPNVWSFRDTAFRDDLLPFVFNIALTAAAMDTDICAKDLLPKDLGLICSGLRRNLDEKTFIAKAKEEIENAPRKERDSTEKDKDPRAMSYEEKQDAEKFLTQQLPHLRALTIALKDVLSATGRTLDRKFVALIEAWESARKYKDTYGTGEQSHLYRVLGLELALLALWSRRELKETSVKRLLEAAHSQQIGPTDLTNIVAILALRKHLQQMAGEQAVKTRALIETENDVASRAAYFAALAQAILPTSVDEASAYFRAGLEQMDSIGSGDYEFTNDLLLFASTLNGEELEEQEFHTLTNIAELNLGDEPHKFFWVAYAKGLSKVAGARALAKLSRWDDRSKIGLDYTLLPNLITLISDGKLEPELAVALNRLANPAEYHEFGTKEFAAALQEKGATTKPEITTELVNHFLDENPGTPYERTLQVLLALADATLGSNAEITKHLKAGAESFGTIREIQNEHLNYRGADPDPFLKTGRENPDREKKAALKEILRVTKPAEGAALLKALADVSSLDHIWDLKGGFFDALRKQVPYESRSGYIKGIAGSEHMNWYWKIGELEECKKQWSSSSASLDSTFREIALPLLRMHAKDIAGDDRFSGYKIKEIADLTGLPMADFLLELIKALAQPDSINGSRAWLGLACLISPNADDGHGQLALKRLLASDAAILANNVMDGTWRKGIYPENNTAKIASGLIWRQLGSPYAEDRWRAAHSIRALGRVARWDAVDLIVQAANSKTAGAFQAEELEFYFLHAKLWLCIALARLALDHPHEVAKYNAFFKEVVFEDQTPHVLMRQFAGHAMVTCIDAGAIVVSPAEAKTLRAVDKSPHPRLKKKIRDRRDSYQGRPDGTPKPKFEFHLDYEFKKHDVDSLGRVFGKGCWEVADLMSGIVHKLDPSISGMYDSKGRQVQRSRDSYGMTDRHHSYGQQLGWHAMFFAAAKLLEENPVVNDSWMEEDGDPWNDWLHRYNLTRDDGLWLSDGTDRTPVDTQSILLEKAKTGLELTGDQQKIMKLVGLDSGSQGDVAVKGDWYSSDAIKVSVMSALVSPEEAVKLARGLLKEEPISVWVPCFSQGEDGSEYRRDEEKKFFPWIVDPSGDERLDKQDPYGVGEANLRPHLAEKYRASASLSKADEFGRIWRDKKSKIALKVDAWGRDDTESDRGPHPGVRLICSRSTLKSILKKHDKTLLLVITLRRSERESFRGSTNWTHTVAVVTVTQNCDAKYFKGQINHLHKDRW